MGDFTLEATDYTRNFNVVKQYVEEHSLALARLKGVPIEKTREFVKRQIRKDGKLAMIDPRMRYVGRNAEKDREVKFTSLISYIGNIDRRKLIVSPTMTVYQNPEVERSISAMYIAVNVKARSVAKGEMFTAKESGNKDLEILKKNEQQTRKIKNNALSGAHVSASTPLYIHTIHSSLTSTCRAATSYANSNNEKILAGNRYYWSYLVTYANILNIVTLTDRFEFENLVDKYELHLPSTEEVMEMVTKATNRYWRNAKKLAYIERMVDALEPVERAMVLYVGDLHHLAKYNRELCYDMITEFAEVKSGEYDNPAATLKGLDELSGSLVMMLCYETAAGISIKKVKELTHTQQCVFAGTADNVRATTKKYLDLLRGMFVTENMPASIATIPNIIRDVAVTSDTDSTMYTVERWWEWYSGHMRFTDTNIRIGHVLSFFASSAITHVLAKMSANMGVRSSQIFQYAMKPEYFFPVFALTSRAKTYWAGQGAQEGQVFKEIELEIKGAVMKASNSPKFIIKDVVDTIRTIVENLMANKKISLRHWLNHVANIELDILGNLRSGGVKYLKGAEIKPPDSYTKEANKSPYRQYMMWQEVFADFYGPAPEPPYNSVKVSLSIKNKTDLNNFFDGMENPEIARRLRNFMATHEMANLTTIHVPRDIALNDGVPDVLRGSVGARRIISNIMEPYYVILESLGYYAIDKNHLRLVHDRYGDVDVDGIGTKPTLGQQGAIEIDFDDDDDEDYADDTSDSEFDMVDMDEGSDYE